MHLINGLIHRMDSILNILSIGFDTYKAWLLPLLAFSNELSRLTVNCVTSEDYSRPERIATFISTLHTGFRFKLSFDQL